MNIQASAKDIAAARAYEDLHVPALFRQFAPEVLTAAGVGSGQRVLDVACGTGILAREAEERVGDTGVVAGLDATPGMLAVAQQLAPSIDWRLASAESLPWADESFNTVVSQFGLMFFQDRVNAIAEMLRVLVPGGRLAVAVWDSLENSAAYPEAVALLEDMAGPAAADALRAPFVLGDQSQLAALFTEAGVADIKVTTCQGTARFPSIRVMVEADLRGWLPIMGVHLEDSRIEAILQAAEDVLARYVNNDGEVEFNAPAHIVAGARP
ncbi:class I SAM-dependent methyltransferase [Elongatibacter sediminis]|uniref:Methyltransferase domain-containing protein n=1 Tax=Elongatibacter sediminis TaxID=3119006 RepID=A0AAW9RGT8_9GAMM